MVSRLVGKVPGNVKRSMLLMAALLAVGLTGCATKKSSSTEPVFFPPAPNPPRVQYLKGVNGSKDVVKEKASFSVFSFGQVEEEAVKFISKPYGISTEKGKIYVVDSIANDVLIMDLAQQAFQALPGNKGLGKMRKPINLAVSKDGNLFVADTFRKEILMYDPSGAYLKAYGKDMNMKPVDVAVDDVNLYALDYANNEIKVIDRSSGELLRSIGKSTETVQGLSMPTNMTIDSAGYLYVTNVGSGKIIKLDRDGHIVFSFGKMGDAFSEFGRPRGIAVDKEGRIYVVDASHQNVQIFNDKGRLLMFFGDPGYVEGSLNLPAGVTISTDNLEYFQKFADKDFILEQIIVVTNQFGPVKVAFYGLGHLKGTVPPSNYEEPKAEPKPKAGEGKGGAAQAAPAPAK